MVARLVNPVEGAVQLVCGTRISAVDESRRGVFLVKGRPGERVFQRATTGAVRAGID